MIVFIYTWLHERGGKKYHICHKQMFESFGLRHEDQCVPTERLHLKRQKCNNVSSLCRIWFTHNFANTELPTFCFLGR